MGLYGGILLRQSGEIGALFPYNLAHGFNAYGAKHMAYFIVGGVHAFGAGGAAYALAPKG